jgi:hypothetical protein
MAIVVIQQPEAITREMYDAVNAKLDVENDPPEGMVVHTFGQAPDGRWQVVDVWESQEAHDKFAQERLRPAIEEMMREVGGEMPDGPPNATVYEIHHLVAPAGVAAS